MKRLVKLLFGLIFPRINSLLSSFTKKRTKEVKSSPRDDQISKRTAPIIAEKVVFREIENHTIAEFEISVTRLAKAGRADGVSGLRSMAKRDIEISHGTAEEKIILEYDAKALNIEQDLVKVKAKLKDESHLALEKTQEDRRRIELQQEVELEGASLSDGAKKGLPISQQISSLERELEKSLEEKEWQDGNLTSLVEDGYGDKKPRHSWIDNKRIFLGIVVLLILVEWYVNFESFQMVEGLIENNLAAIIFGLVLAAFQAFGAKGYGAHLFRQDKQKKRAFLLLTLGACGFISYFRFAGQADLVASIASVSINVIIAVVTAFLAYFHERHVEYFDCVKLRNKASDRIFYCNGELGKLRKIYASKLELAEKGAVEERLSHETERQEGCKDRIGQLEVCLKELNLEKQKALAKLDQIKNDANAKYEADYHAGAKVAGHLSIRKNLSASGGNGLKISSLLLIATLSLASCSQSLNDRNLEVVLDVTGKTRGFTAEEVEQEVWEVLRLEETGNKGNVTVNISTISHVTETAVTTVKLGKSGNFLFRNERKEDEKIANFRKELVGALESAAQSREEKLYSYVNRNLSSRLNFLSRQKGRKLMLVWSDLLQHRPPDLSFYHYKLDPQKLIRDAQDLTAKMEADSPLRPLHGVWLVNFHRAEKSTDELHRASKKLLGDYWLSRGLQVEFRTSLGKVKPPLAEVK